MTLDIVSSLMRDGITLILMLSLPAIGLGLIIGLTVAIMQALTQVQEQTLTFVPKMIAVLLMIALTSSWMGSQLIAFCQRLWIMIPSLTQ